MKDAKRNIAPLDEGFYQTGTVDHTNPRGGLVMVLLVAVVLLGGIITILGLLNIRLFAALKSQERDALQLENTESAVEATTPEVDKPKLTMELEEDQQENMTPQQIYANCIDSMVSIHGDSAEGTGLVLSTNGYILTDCTLVQQCRELIVELSNRRCLTATIVGIDPMTNLAVIHVDAVLTPPVFGDSDTLAVGDAVSIPGDPLGSRYDGTLSNSTVSSVSGDAIGTDAPWNHAGPLLDRFGKVIGVRVGNSQYAIPTATIKTIAEQLVGQGYVSGRPGLAVEGEPVPELHQKFYGLPKGLYVTAADLETGLEAGDILLSINGQSVSSKQELLDALLNCRVGDRVTVELYRDDTYHFLTVHITEARR